MSRKVVLLQKRFAANTVLARAHFTNGSQDLRHGCIRCKAFIHTVLEGTLLSCHLYSSVFIPLYFIKNYSPKIDKHISDITIEKKVQSFFLFRFRVAKAAKPCFASSLVNVSCPIIDSWACASSKGKFCRVSAAFLMV